MRKEINPRERDRRAMKSNKSTLDRVRFVPRRNRCLMFDFWGHALPRLTSTVNLGFNCKVNFVTH